jgi:hypothetical protein
VLASVEKLVAAIPSAAELASRPEERIVLEIDGKKLATVVVRSNNEKGERRGAAPKKPGARRAAR